jgi:hypothetical protein
VSLSEQHADKARTALVEFILAARRRYLRTYGAAVVLKHWEQLQGRILSAARRCGTVDEWTTAVLRGLQLPTTLDKLGAQTLWDLSKVARDHGDREVLDLVERETGLLMAMARLITETRAEERRAHEGEIDDV